MYNFIHNKVDVHSKNPKLLKIMIILFMLLSVQPNSLLAQWTRTKGPEGIANISTMVSTSTHILVGTSNGVNVSADQGETWELKITGLEHTGILMLYSYEDIIYAVTDGESDFLYKTTNYGDTWEKLSDTSNEVRVIAGNSEAIIVSSYPLGFVYRSLDQGETWIEIPYDPDFPSFSPKKLIESNGIFYASNKYGIFKSDDLGENWEQIYQSNYAPSDFIVSGDTIVSRFDDIVYSFDNGSTWNTNDWNSGSTFKEISLLGDTLVVYAGKYIHHSFDWGLNWDFTSLPEIVPYEVGYHFCTHQGKIYLDLNDGIYVTDDLGETVELKQTGIYNTSILAVGAANNLLCVGNEHFGFYFSSNNGETWIKNNEGIGGYSGILQISNDDNGRLYASNAALLKFNNQTESWNQFAIPGKEDILFHNGSIYGAYGPFGNGGSMHRSDDGGNTWIEIEEGLNLGTYGNDCPAFLASIGDTVYAASRNSKVYYTLDKGETWIHLATLNTIFPSSSILKFEVIGSELIASSGSANLVRSSDGGNTWYDIPNLPGTTISFLKAYENKLFVGTSFGLFMSFDAGDTWVPMNDGLPFLNTKSAAIGNGYFYLGFSGGGVWKRPLEDFFFKKVTGTVYLDENNNGIFDNGESGMPNTVIHSSVSNTSALSNYMGEYTIFIKPGIEDTINATSPLIYTTINPPFNVASPSDSVGDFGLHLIPEKSDLQVSLTNVQPANRGFPVDFVITYKNKGTTILDGSIYLVIDTMYQYINSMPAADLINGDTLIWYFSDLQLFNSENIDIHLFLPPSAPLGTELFSFAAGEIDSSDENLNDNVDELFQIAVGSYDPNDKSVEPSIISLQEATYQQTLEYTIRFQNIGTYLAKDVVIKDTLSALFDINTFEVVSASHAYNLDLRLNGILTIKFDNINLPDSTTNEPESHGFFKYAIKTKSDLILVDTIENIAHIYFDFNDPVITNLVQTSIFKPVYIENNFLELCEGDEWNGVTWYDNQLFYDTISNYFFDSVFIYNINVNPEFTITVDTSVSIGETIGAVVVNSDTIWTENLLSTFGCDSAVVYKVTILTNTSNIPMVHDIKVIPNPNSGFFTVEIRDDSFRNVKWQLIDLNGKIVESGVSMLSDSNSSFFSENLKSGLYFLKIIEIDKGYSVSRIVCVSK